MEAGNRFAWNWEDASVDERMALVHHAKSLLDVQFKLRDILSSMDSDPATQKNLLAELEKDPLLKRKKELEPEWLLPLRGEIDNLLAELKNNCAILDKMTAALDRLNTEDTDFKALAAELKRLGTAASGSVRVRAQDLADILKRLGRNQNDVAANQTAVTAMRFDAIIRDVPFVSPDECIISSRILKKRNQLAERQAALLRKMENLKYLLAKLKNNGLDKKGGTPEIVERFNSRKTLEEAFRFDCLKEKMPNPRRKAPSGIYDRMFGIRFFYEIILQSSLQPTNLYSTDLISGLDFQPDCIALAALYRAVEETDLWLALPENQWMLNGATKTLKRRCETLLQCRAMEGIPGKTADVSGRIRPAEGADSRKDRGVHSGKRHSGRSRGQLGLESEMTGKRNIVRKRSVLLEYTILLCSILPLVFAASASIYSLSGFGGGSFGPIGKGIVALYQRIITVISLPIP